MDEDEAFAAIKNAIKAVAWPAPAPRVYLPNEGNPGTASESEYVVVEIPAHKTTQRSMGTTGSQSWECHGQVVVAFHVPLGVGDARALALAKALRLALVGKRVGGILYRDQERIAEGPGRGRYFLVDSLTFDYYRQQ